MSEAIEMTSTATNRSKVEHVVSCGKCGKTWCDEDFIENQECLHKHDVGGYGSVFGDGNEWSVTLCQNCAYELLLPYIVWRDS